MAARLALLMLLCWRGSALSGVRHLKRHILSPRRLATTSTTTCVKDELDLKGVEEEAPGTKSMKLAVDGEPVKKISILRSGSTRIGPLGRLATIFPGDYVVHSEKGVAQYLNEVEDDNGEKNILLGFYAQIEYTVPPHERLKLSRLKAADSSSPPKLTALTEKGLKQWQATLDKVRESTRQQAGGILDLYAARNDLQRAPCLPDDSAFDAFEKRFEYEATSDQQKCFDDVARDMIYQTTPMDRLVCGDVGFGKTEVAMRAIYRAARNNRQVAMLAPTTVLAVQHFRTLCKRMPDVDIVLLKGGTTQTAEGARLRASILDGRARVVVGTHALFSKSVVFKKLELLVVDEEQRFGVVQKERLKAMASGVDVLTLTATPIPRTLQMSLSGIRDLSTLRTPPPGRQEIETHVLPFDVALVKGAIEREVARGGQSFFVVPRIANIPGFVGMLEEHLPNVTVAVAHGRMKDVEKIVTDFSSPGGSNVLVATSVIESGLDLPNANTIVVTNPSSFGLAALYQLRGRVGRSPRKAFAYFCYPGDQPMSVDSLRRLQALRELGKLGSGFELANRDLEIRGAGAIIGQKQSGAADKVGPEVYMALLQQALEEAKGTEITPVTNCAIALSAVEAILAKGLPSDFLPGDENARQEVTSAAMSARKPREISALGKQWCQRMATMDAAAAVPPTTTALPGGVEALLKIHILQSFGRRLGVVRVRVVEGGDLELEVPTWSSVIWRHLGPTVDDVYQQVDGVDGSGKWIHYNDEAKLVALEGLGEAPPAKQLAVLLSFLGKLYVFLEGKENFGFN